MTELSERLTQFSVAVIAFANEFQLDTISRPLIAQVVRSATSVGANYTESQSGSSRKDFRAKIYIAQKEAEETKYWLTLLESAYPSHRDKTGKLRDEIQQIIKILQSILTKINSSLDP